MGRALGRASSRAADDDDAQLKLATGQPQGQPHPTSVARGAPARALPCRGRPIARLRRPRDRGGGAARTYITKRTYTNAPLQRELAAKKRPPSASRSCPTGPNNSAALRRRRAAAQTAKTGSPSGAPGSNSPGGAGGGRAPQANKTPPGAK